MIKALNKVVLNGGHKVCVEIAGENTGKSDKNGKKKKTAAEKTADKNSKAEKQRNRVERKEDMLIPVVQRKKMIGSSSSSRTISHYGEKSQIFRKRVGPNVANGKNK